MGSSSLTRDRIRAPCIGSHGVLAPGPPGKSQPVGFFVHNLYHIKEVPLYSQFAEFLWFFLKLLNFVKCFFLMCVVMIMWFFFFGLSVWEFILIDYWMLSEPFIPGVDSTWSWCVILFMQCLDFILFYFLKFIFGCVVSLLLRVGFSLVAASRGYSSLRCAGFSLRWLLLLRSTGSRCTGFSSCGTQALERRLSSCGARA